MEDGLLKIVIGFGMVILILLPVMYFLVGGDEVIFISIVVEMLKFMGVVYIMIIVYYGVKRSLDKNVLEYIFKGFSKVSVYNKIIMMLLVLIVLLSFFNWLFRIIFVSVIVYISYVFYKEI